MADNSTILEKLDGLVARFEEISTLITDPAVIADQKRYVKLTKEYKELDDLMKARKEYMQLLGNIEEARNILANESDADMREMAKEEMDSSQERLPVLEEEIKLMLVPADPQDSKNSRNPWRYRRRRSRYLCRRPFPYVCQVLRNQRLENGSIQRQRRGSRRFQGNHLQRDG